jgi:hypothetical protein
MIPSLASCSIKDADEPEAQETSAKNRDVVANKRMRFTRAIRIMQVNPNNM